MYVKIPINNLKEYLQIRTLYLGVQKPQKYTYMYGYRRVVLSQIIHHN